MEIQAEGVKFEVQGLRGLAFFVALPVYGLGLRVEGSGGTSRLS